MIENEEIKEDFKKMIELGNNESFRTDPGT